MSNLIGNNLSNLFLGKLLNNPYKRDHNENGTRMKAILSIIPALAVSNDWKDASKDMEMHMANFSLFIYDMCKTDEDFKYVLENETSGLFKACVALCNPLECDKRFDDKMLYL